MNAAWFTAALKLTFFVCLFRKGSNKKMLLELHWCLMRQILNRSGLVIYCPTWLEINTEFHNEQLFIQSYLSGLVNRNYSKHRVENKQFLIFIQQ